LIHRVYSQSSGTFTQQTTLAENVDRFVVDDSTSEPGGEFLAPNTLHIRIFLYATDPSGQPITVSATSYVSMRNTEEP
ncbi:MAG: hypothetical protein ACRELB_27410, partial [Polyangiaceae bacterium]